MEKINEKHKSVCKHILDGMPDYKAYMMVYNNVKNEATARANSSKLLTKSNIKAYIAEQRTILEATAVMSREYKRKKLKEVVDNPESQNALISAIKVDNEMVGHNAPIKTEVTNNNPLQLSIEAIKAISNELEEDV